MDVKFRRLRDVKLPELGTENSAGWDMFVPSSFSPLDEYARNVIAENELNYAEWEHYNLWPNCQITIPSGLQMYMPKLYSSWDGDHQFHFEIFNRSSLAKSGLILGAQIVDADYEGELHFQIWNVSQQTIVIKRGQKIAQGIFRETLKVSIHEVQHIKYPSSFNRGKGGFGSTGK